MLMANVLAKLDRMRDDLETEKQDLNRVNNLIKCLQDQKARIIADISYIEFKIEELEDELDDNS